MNVRAQNQANAADPLELRLEQTPVSRPVDSEEGATIHIVEQDSAVAGGMRLLFGALEARVKTYASAESVLGESIHAKNGCLIIEMNLPGMSGLELLSRLRARGVTLPAIMLTSKGDIATAVEAMRAGALDFIEKPFVDRVLLARVRQALQFAPEPSP